MTEPTPSVALDLGGIVLTDPTLGDFWSAIASARGDDGHRAKTRWFSELRGPFERGEVSEDLVWDALAEASGSTPGSVRSRFLDGFVEIPAGLHALQLCKEAHFRVVLATNHYAPWIPMWRQKFDWFGEFDQVVCSSDVGARKPEPAFYAAALTASRPSGLPVCFVDDVIENVEAASESGFVGVLGDDTGDWIKEVIAGGRVQ